MRPSRTEKPVARTPKTPAARSPFVKKPPSGARRRTRSRADTASAMAAATIASAHTMVMARLCFYGRCPKQSCAWATSTVIPAAPARSGRGRSRPRSRARSRSGRRFAPRCSRRRTPHAPQLGQRVLELGASRVTAREPDRRGQAAVHADLARDAQKPAESVAEVLLAGTAAVGRLCVEGDRARESAHPEQEELAAQDRGEQHPLDRLLRGRLRASSDRDDGERQLLR